MDGERDNRAGERPDEKKRGRAEKRRADWDDGRTVAVMNGDELPPYRKFGFSNRKNKRELAASDDTAAHLTKKEKRAMRRAMFAVLIPRLAVIVLGFALVFALVYLWLM